MENILQFLTLKFNYIGCSIEEAQDTRIIFIDESKLGYSSMSKLLVLHMRKKLWREHKKVLKIGGMGCKGYRVCGRIYWMFNFEKLFFECFDCEKWGNL